MTFLMQKLPREFANFLKHNICDNLILCRDNGENQTLNIIVNNDRKFTTRIRSKWNKFARTNEFRPRCTVIFKFSINNCYVCHVFHVK
jgi:hypothetical protein